MRSIAPALVAVVTLAACGDDGASRRLPPETAIDDHPAALTNQPHATFTFHAGGVADHFTCALDHGSEVPCTAPFEADVTDGDHTFSVRAAIGTVLDDTPAEIGWKVDTMPPDTTITSAPPALDNATSPDVVFAGSDNNGAVTFECALDGGAFAACSSPATLAALLDGSHQYRVRAIDAAGNADPTPATVAWVLDSTAPDTMITGGPAAGASTKAQVSFTFGSPDSPVTFECALDTGAFAACASPKTYTLAEGAHTFAVRAKDPTGLADPSPASRAWMVDLTPPAVAITSGPTGVTSDATPSFGFTVTGATTIECHADGDAFAPCASPFTTSALADGNHTITVRGTDAAGNAASASRAFSVDTTAPSVAITPVNPSPTNDRTPTIGFTVTGATTIQCQTDGGGLTPCTSPFTTASLGDGNHTFAVRAADAAGNATTASTSFAVDATPPAVAIDDAPPAQWPVNYYDLKFSTGDPTASLSCVINGQTIAPCASPLTVTVAYNVASTFTVTARDPAGNTASASRSWTPRMGLVLHYPWEQGQTHNSSLLAQRAGYSPDGTVTVPVVGGWAGTAAGSPAVHAYKATKRPLSSSPDNGYTASIWVRVHAGSSGGTVLSTLGTGDGFSLSLEGRQAVLRVNDAGPLFTAAGVVPPNQWVQLGVLATGPTKGVQLLVNGNPVALAATPVTTGFGSGQAPDLKVGGVAGVDLDDLRFYNRALQGAELCTVLARGTVNANGGCDALSPGMELDFEGNQIVDTGAWNAVLGVPGVVSFPPTKLGTGVRIERNDQTFAYNQNVAGNLAAAPGHSFGFWFMAGAPTDTLYDFLHPCSPVAVLTCGIRVVYVNNGGIVVQANGGAQTAFTVAIPVTVNGPHSLLVTEQKADANGTTAQLSIYLDGVLTVLPIGTVNVYAAPSDTIVLPHNVVGTQLDEVEFWPRDLSADPEMLCENGWDGEWSPATGVCLMTSN